MKVVLCYPTLVLFLQVPIRFDCHSVVKWPWHFLDPPIKSCLGAKGFDLEASRGALCLIAVIWLRLMDVLDLEQAESGLNENLCKAAVCKFTRIPINGSFIAFLNQIRAISFKKKFPYGTGKRREGRESHGLLQGHRPLQGYHVWLQLATHKENALMLQGAIAA